MNVSGKMGSEVIGKQVYMGTEISPWLFLAGFALLVYFFPLASWIKLAWRYYVESRIDFGDFQNLALPPGTMGYPILGESIDFLKKVSKCFSHKEKNSTIDVPNYIVFKSTLF